MTKALYNKIGWTKQVSIQNVIQTNRFNTSIMVALETSFAFPSSITRASSAFNFGFCTSSALFKNWKEWQKNIIKSYRSVKNNPFQRWWHQQGHVAKNSFFEKGNIAPIFPWMDNYPKMTNQDESCVNVTKDWSSTLRYSEEPMIIHRNEMMIMIQLE